LSTSYPASLFRRGHAIRAISESFNIWRNTYGKQASLNDVFKATIRAALIPDCLRRWRRYLLTKSQIKKILGNNLQGTPINRDFAREVDVESRLAQLAAHTALGFHSSLREKHVQNIMHPYLTNALERYDRVAAICTVEPRHPLLDKRLVEHSVSLPWDQKVRHGWSKFIIRRAGESLLPGEVVWRRGWDDIGWLFTSALIQKRSAWMAKQIRQQQALLSRYVDQKMLKYIAKECEVIALSEHEVSIWRVFQLANWLQHQQPIQEESFGADKL
jgi:asparagine synthetase B (glutamine-hydrolysing)